MTCTVHVTVVAEGEMTDWGKFRKYARDTDVLLSLRNRFVLRI